MTLIVWKYLKFVSIVYESDRMNWNVWRDLNFLSFRSFVFTVPGEKASVVRPASRSLRTEHALEPDRRPYTQQQLHLHSGLTHCVTDHTNWSFCAFPLSVSPWILVIQRSKMNYSSEYSSKILSYKPWQHCAVCGRTGHSCFFVSLIQIPVSLTKGSIENTVVFGSTVCTVFAGRQMHSPLRYMTYSHDLVHTLQLLQLIAMWHRYFKILFYSNAWNFFKINQMSNRRKQLHEYTNR